MAVQPAGHVDGYFRCAAEVDQLDGFPFGAPRLAPGAGPEHGVHDQLEVLESHRVQGLGPVRFHDIDAQVVELFQVIGSGPLPDVDRPAKQQDRDLEAVERQVSRGDEAIPAVVSLTADDQRPVGAVAGHDHVSDGLPGVLHQRGVADAKVVCVRLQRPHLFDRDIPVHSPLLRRLYTISMQG